MSAQTDAMRLCNVNCCSLSHRHQTDLCIGRTCIVLDKLRMTLRWMQVLVPGAEDLPLRH